MAVRSRVALYIDPPTYHFLEDGLFDSATAPHGGDDILAPYRLIREHFGAHGIEVHTADLMGPQSDGRRNIYVSMGMQARYEELARRPDTVLSGFFAMECPIVEPALYRGLPAVGRAFRRVFSWSDGDALQPFTGERMNFETFRWPQCFDRVHEDIWSRTDHRKFLVMINANKLPRLYQHELYTKRLEAIRYFHGHGEIDLYGRHWERVPIRLGKPAWMPWTMVKMMERLRQLKQNILPNPVYAAARAASHGPTASKSRTMGDYRFALCFENMILKGWITEKLFDCFFVGTVPIYWGEPEIEKAVPPDCYVDMRRFRDFVELRRFLKGLSGEQIEGYRVAARRFLESPAFRPFSARAFLDIFRRLVREDAGVDV